MDNYYPFPCKMCGKCCHYVNMIPDVRYLDRGDGVCRYLTSENKCEIYPNRPDLCNGRYLYETFYSKNMSVEDFHRIMLTLCEEIRGGRLDRLYRKIQENK